MIRVLDTEIVISVDALGVSDTNQISAAVADWLENHTAIKTSYLHCKKVVQDDKGIATVTIGMGF